MMSVLLDCVTSAWCDDKEKVLFSFEREEVERLFTSDDPTNTVQIYENGDFSFRRHKPIEDFQEREMQSILPVRCVREKSSEGKYSCKVVEIIDRLFYRAPSFRMPRILSEDLWLKTPQANLRLPELLNTAGWFDVVFPRDWSGWERLRVDVFVQNAQAECLMLEVEDDLVEPPVSMTYTGFETGQWVTLELDLVQAVKERGLNLARMNNIWIRMKLKDVFTLTRSMREMWEKKDYQGLEALKTIAYVDNIRLCRADAPCRTPVLKGVRSQYTINLPRAYAAEEHYLQSNMEYNFDYFPTVRAAELKMPEQAKIKFKPGPLHPQAPEIIPIRDMIKKGCLKDEPENDRMHSNIRLTCVSALDADRIIVAFDLFGTGSLRTGITADRIVGNNSAVAVATTDGGRTWKGLAGTDWPTIVGGNQTKPPGRLWDLGGNIMAASPFGCLGIRSAGVGYPVDRTFFIRSVFTGDGWWVSPHYFVTGEPRHCHWMWWVDLVEASDGRLWMAWESVDRYGYGTARTYSILVYCSDDGGKTWQSWRGAGFNGMVPSFGSTLRNRRYVKVVPYGKYIAVFAGEQWSYFDGEKWSEVETTGVEPWGAVSCGNEIWLSSPAGPEKWYDGKTWREFSVPGRVKEDRGLITICGRVQPVYIAHDATWKKLLCWRRDRNGVWQGPEELVSEQTVIKQIAAPRYSPTDFVPVAYMCLTQEAEKKNKGEPITRKTPGNQHYHGTPPSKLFWTYPSGYWEHEPWIKLLKVPVRNDATDKLNK